MFRWCITFRFWYRWHLRVKFCGVCYKWICLSGTDSVLRSFDYCCILYISWYLVICYLFLVFLVALLNRGLIFDILTLFYNLNSFPSIIIWTYSIFLQRYSYYVDLFVLLTVQNLDTRLIVSNLIKFLFCFGLV